jgi:hypothetical protein
MTQNKNRKQAIRERMQADQVPYTEAARRTDAEKAGLLYGHYIANLTPYRDEFYPGVGPQRNRFGR